MFRKTSKKVGVVEVTAYLEFDKLIWENFAGNTFTWYLDEKKTYICSFSYIPHIKWNAQTNAV